MTSDVCTKAKKKLKRHLERYVADEEFEVTPQKMVYWFNVINAAVFSEKLPRPTFTTKPLKHAWGYCSAGPLKIEITIDSDISSRDLFMSTLAHEMVHLWQHVFEGRMSHVNSFTRWKRMFDKKIGIAL